MSHLSTASNGYRSWRAVRFSTRVRTGEHWFNQPLEINIESTSYGLLSTLIMANRTTATENGLDVVKWLNEERNANGGFRTSQVRRILFFFPKVGKQNFVLLPN